MKYGFYSDSNLTTFDKYPFRCPSWTPFPTGKKNVVILGCSHTWGVGLEADETWAHHISQHNTNRLRYWNLGQPGAAPDTLVRILYSSEKVLFPKIIIAMWPEISRRERLENYAQSVHGTDERLRWENEKTDTNNLLKCVFFVEKFAEHTNCTVFHCFSDDVVDLQTNKNKTMVLTQTSLRDCWPYWDSVIAREFHSDPSRARDGLHYGVENHKRFADVFLENFGPKLK